jgi:hypothetical protein
MGILLRNGIAMMSNTLRLDYCLQLSTSLVGVYRE